MKKLIPLLLFLLVACRKQDHSKEVRQNFSAIISSMNADDTYISNRVPVKVKAVLFQVMNENLYFEMNSQDDARVVTREWYYNHYPGDTVHFDRLRIERFFKITRQIPKRLQPERLLTREQILFPETKISNR